MTAQGKNSDTELEQLFLDRILLIDNVKHIRFGNDDNREAFVLLGTPAQLIEAIDRLANKRALEELEAIYEDWHEVDSTMMGLYVKTHIARLRGLIEGSKS